jgi:hypothetical protein
MRKVLLGVLVLAAAAGLFAQELKFDGYFNSGLGLVLTNTELPDSVKKENIKVVPFGVDAGVYGYRFRLNGSYANAESTAGAKFRFQAQNTADWRSFSFPYAYGWFSFLNKIFTVTGGLVDDSTWASGGAILNDDVGEGLGALVKITPVTGLNLGVGAYVITPQSGSSNNILVVPAGAVKTEPVAAVTKDVFNDQSQKIGTVTISEATTKTTQPSTSGFSGLDIPLDRIKYTFSAGYTMPDVFKAAVSFRTKNQAGDAVSRYDSADAEKFDGSGESSKLIFSASVLAVKPLTAVVEVEVDKLESTGTAKDDMNINFYETLGYKIGNLAFGLNAVQYYGKAKNAGANKVEDKDLGLHFNPWISYTIGSVVPRLDVNYFKAGTAITIPAENALPAGNYHRTVFAYKDNGKDADDFTVIAVRPSVKFNIGSKTFVEIGDLVAFASGPANSFGDAGDAKKSSNLSNVFYVDFVWKF